MHSNSLRRQLLQRLLWPFIAILLAGALLAYLFAHQAARNAIDLGLLDDALDLTKQIKVHEGEISLRLPLAAQQMLLVNNSDQVVFAAWDKSGHLIAGDGRLMPLVRNAAEESYWFTDVTLDGHDGRIVLLRNTIRGYLVNVAVFQTSLGSERLSRDTFISMLLPEALLALVAVFVILFGVRQGLHPVESLRDEIISRSPSDMRPIEEAPAPEELRPIIHGINELLENLATAFTSHRRFIADASHQLRTPLAALSSQIEVALKQPPADVQALLRQLLAGTQRTSHLANQLLSLARLEHTETALCEKSAIDLRQVITDAAASFVALAERKGVELEFRLQAFPMHGSALLLGEMLVNLLDNALRYTPAEGQVVVSLQADADGCALLVSDSGPGVAGDELDKLGMPFYRTDASLPGGCGLGLAIVREIARIHGAVVDFSLASRAGGLAVLIRFASA
ncbi:sensor protein QseC [mine drainage metagenome]|uniref:histidine kinase n=1 Tax=mine drainage metagenome TaxID=410659 RepID=A0A1J5QVI6_9ZZZZ